MLSFDVPKRANDIGSGAEQIPFLAYDLSIIDAKLKGHDLWTGFHAAKLSLFVEAVALLLFLLDLSFGSVFLLVQVVVLELPLYPPFGVHSLLILLPLSLFL